MLLKVLVLFYNHLKRLQVTVLNFTWAPGLLQNSDFKEITSHPFEFRKKKKTAHCKEPPFPYDSDKTHGCPPRLPRTRPDTDPPNSHALPPKWIAELSVLTGPWEQNACQPSFGYICLLSPDPELCPTLSLSQHTAPWTVRWPLKCSLLERMRVGKWDERRLVYCPPERKPLSPCRS